MRKQKTTKAAKVTKDLYAAVDLHGDNGFYCVINEQDQRVFQQRLPNDLALVLAALEPYRQRLVKGIAVETVAPSLWKQSKLRRRTEGERELSRRLGGDLVR